MDTLRDGAIIAGLIIDYQHQKVEIVPVEWRGAAVPPWRVRAHGREIAVQIAISRDLEIARRVVLMLSVLAAQVPPLGAAGGGMGGGGLGGAQVWGVGYVAVARRRDLARSRPRSRSREI